MEWELTDEEIEAIYIEESRGNPHSLALLWRVWRRIREAQARKLVEWLEKQDKHQRFGFKDGTLLIYNEDWQELRRQVGLDKEIVIKHEKPQREHYGFPPDASQRYM